MLRLWRQVRRAGNLDGEVLVEYLVKLRETENCLSVGLLWCPSVRSIGDSGHGPRRSGTACIRERAPHDHEALVNSGRIDGDRRQRPAGLARGFGLAGREAGIQVLPASIFRLASISKPLTGMAILELVQDGRLSLDAKFVDVIPNVTRHRTSRPIRACETSRFANCSSTPEAGQVHSRRPRAAVHACIARPRCRPHTADVHGPRPLCHRAAAGLTLTQERITPTA